MTEKASFELSRIYAKGWAAGRECSITGPDDELAATIAALNPYRTGEEEKRWTLGFQDARRRSQKMPVRNTTPRRNSTQA